MTTAGWHIEGNVQMSNNRNQSTRLKALLAALKSEQKHTTRSGHDSFNPPLTNEYVEYNPIELPQYQNAYQLYSNIAVQIKCESDLSTVREIALYYLDIICQEMPDSMSQRISERILG